MLFSNDYDYMFYITRAVIGAIIINSIKGKRTKKNRLWMLVGIVLMMPIKISNGYMILLNPIVFLLIIAIIYEIYLKVYVKIRNKDYEQATYRDIDTLNREVDFEYNPSIVGYLINQQLELRDLSADILNLYAKKIINIKKDEKNNYNITYGEKYEEYEEKINSSDKYIIEKLIKKLNKFNFLEWKHKVLTEYNSLYLSKNKEYMSDKKFYMIVIIMVILGISIFKIVFNSIGQGLIVSLICAVGYVLVYTTIYQNNNNKKLKLTNRGEKEIKKCIKLKSFMKKYTLLKDRKIEEICIYERYIPYAVALGINKKYYGTIFEIFGERELKDIIEDIDVIDEIWNINVI